LNPLLGIPSPRDITTFKEHIDALKADKLWCKYYKELEAYQRIRKYFLSHPDYTHLIICPDDLIVKPYDLTRLIHGLNRYSHPILSGMCNLDSKEETKSLVNITPLKHVPHAEPYLRRYVWMSTKSKRMRKGEIFQVGYAGFGLFAIRRDIVEKIPFRHDGICCIDTFFCWDCKQANIPIFVDPKINMLHLKVADGEYQDYHVDTKKAFTYLDKSKPE
jgi:hypothetical protein